MNKKVIAGITTKNEDWIIEKTLRSLNQYCEKIVVYDDGSTDKTEEICRSFDKVIWRVRDYNPDPLKREEGLHRLKLVQLLKEFDPDYALLLDADEIPTPSIVSFINNADENVGLWRSAMINLWEDETKYRVDSYRTKFGTNVQWDPFVSNAWVKYPLMKFDKKATYKYDVDQQWGGCSRYHPAPENVSGPVKEQEDFCVIHYGKLSDFYKSGKKIEYVSKIDEKAGKGTYEQRMDWHNEHNRIHTLETRPTLPTWFWED